jgi:hypothetical protein
MWMPTPPPAHDQHCFWSLQLGSLAQHMDRRGDGIRGYGSVDVAHLLWNKTKISRRQLHIFGKTAIDLPSNRTGKVVAQIVTSPVAPLAVPAGQIVIHVHPVAGLKAAYRRTELSYIARYFVADDARQLATRPATAASIPG